MRFSNNFSPHFEQRDAEIDVGHRLVIDLRDGGCEARCSCGGWEAPPVPARLSAFRPVHARLVAEHRRHVAEVDHQTN
jgi:hypothetical protein